MNSAAQKLIDPNLKSLSKVFSSLDIQWGGVNFIKTKFGTKRYFVIRQPVSRGRVENILNCPVYVPCYLSASVD